MVCRSAGTDTDEVNARYAGTAMPLNIETALANVRYRTEVTWRDTLRWVRADSSSRVETEFGED